VKKERGRSNRHILGLVIRLIPDSYIHQARTPLRTLHHNNEVPATISTRRSLLAVHHRQGLVRAMIRDLADRIQSDRVPDPSLLNYEKAKCGTKSQKMR
jgi:hypothetical protein